MNQIVCDTVEITWFRGWPSQSGMYLVELEDGEHIVTPYRAEPRYVESEQDWDNKTGWTCLTHSRATVIAWAKIPKRGAR
jgi:hypothetical protein